jgi:hypothetical protein
MAGVEVGTAYVTVIPSAKGFAGKLHSEIGSSASKAGRDAGDKAGRSFGEGVKGHVAAAGAIIAGAFAVDKIAGFFKDANAEARESQKVGALTTQVIKSTGGAANVSAKQVGNLATALSNKTGIDDEVIQSGANMLLTFKNVRNEAGKGNDIFNKATGILTDMSAAMGTEPRKAAIQLGKALNDPVKGITALSRVGVTFTDQQKKTIAALVKGGKTAQAQKIILAELNSEFGGAAAAQATMGEKAQTAFKNLEEAIGTAFLPAEDAALGGITKIIIAATNLATKAGPKVQEFFDGAVKAGKTFTAFAKGDLAGVSETNSGVLGFFASAGTIVFRVVGQIKSALAGVDFGQIVGGLSPIATIFRGMLPSLEKLLPVFVQLAGTLGGVLARVLPILAQVFLQIGQSLGGILVKVLPIVADLFGRLAGLIGGVLAQELPIVAQLFSQLAGAVLPILAKLLPVLVKGISQIALTLFPALGRIIVALLPILKPLIQILATLATAVLPIVVALIKILVPILTVAVKVIAAVLTVVAKAVTWFVKLAGNVDIAREAFGKLASWIGGKLTAAFQAVKDWLARRWTHQVDGGIIAPITAAKVGIAKAWNAIRDAFTAAKNWVTGAFKRRHHPDDLLQRQGLGDGDIQQQLGQGPWRPDGADKPGCHRVTEDLRCRRHHPDDLLQRCRRGRADLQWHRERR